MVRKNVIRFSGSEKFVKEAGDLVIWLFTKKNFIIKDGGTRESINPKYKGNYIR